MTPTRTRSDDGETFSLLPLVENFSFFMKVNACYTSDIRAGGRGFDTL